MTPTSDNPRTPAEPRFVRDSTATTPGPLSERQRFVLWQTTGVVIDDTDFSAYPNQGWSWFPPCTGPMDQQWWTKMRAASERVEEALRTGYDLRAHTFAEEVVIATVLNSGCLDEIVDSVRDDNAYDALRGGEDLDFTSTLGDLTDDSDAQFLFPHMTEFDQDGCLVHYDYSYPLLAVQAVIGDINRWFDPY